MHSLSILFPIWSILFTPANAYAEVPETCSQIFARLDLHDIESHQSSNRAHAVFAETFRQIAGNSADSDAVLEAILTLYPSDIARYLNYDVADFQDFYQRFSESIDSVVVSSLINQRSDKISVSILISDRAWMKYLKDETVDLLLRKFSEIVELTNSPRIGIGLSNQFGYILSRKRHSNYVNVILRPMIDEPEFLKSSKHFDLFPALSKRRVQAKWGYGGPQSTDVEMSCDHFVDDEQYLSFARFCGNCEKMPETFLMAIPLKVADAKSKSSTIVRAGGKAIGLIKNIRNRSFLALRNVRNDEGKLILVRGGVYSTHQSIGADETVPWVEINATPATERLFHPIAFMRGLQGQYSNREFKDFLVDLDELAEKRDLSPPQKRGELPAYLSAWQNADNKAEYLDGLGSYRASRILISRWHEVENPVRVLNRLESKHLKSVLLEKWDKIESPSRHLSRLDEADLVDVLVVKWASLENRNDYIDALGEYDFGKILSANWHELNDPKLYLKMIRSETIRKLVLSTKDR